MPVIFSGPGGYVSVSTPNLPGKIRGLKTVIRKGAISAAREIAENYQDALSKGIRSGSLGLTPLTPDTIRTRVMGKTAGATPAKPSKRGTNPLNYTGVSVGAIRVKMRSTAVVEVSQPDNAFIGYSRTRMQDAAKYNEGGFNRRGRFTKKMLAYLHILFRKQRGKRMGPLPGAARVGAAYHSSVAKRPAWSIVREKIAPSVPGTVRSNVSDAIKKSGIKVDF